MKATDLEQFDTNQQPGVKTGRVTTEGDDLYFEVRGNGQPLLMIPGGGGDGGLYAFVADILADEYKVIPYDRRANARSTRNEPQNFEISQQSRDVVAVLRAAGETSAFIFGNSSGAIIALDMAKTQPQAVRAVVAHEPPVVRVLPDSQKWLRYFAGLYWMALRFSVLVATLRFVFVLGIPPVRAMRKAPQEFTTRTEKAGQIDDFFMLHELIPSTNYAPDTALIRQNGVKVFMATGEWSLGKRKLYARTAPILAEKLGCEMVTFPGHHTSFVDTPKEWAATLRSILHIAVK